MYECTIFLFVFYNRFSTTGCIVATKNDQLFVAGGLKKRAFAWFNKTGVCNSYRTALRRNNDLSLNHDKVAVKWKEDHERQFKKMKLEGFNPFDKNEISQFQQSNPAPEGYQV